MTQQFSCDIYTGAEIDEGAAVEFSGANLPTFYVTSSRRDGGVIHIDCYDACKNLDIPFDYSEYADYDEQGRAIWHQTSGILANIGAQCGFIPAAIGVSRLSQMCVAWLKGKSCRQILEDISKVECGFFFCSPSDGLTFAAFDGSAGGGTEIPEGSRTEIKILGSKSISAAVAVDATYGTVYGAVSDWRHSERVSGRYQRDDISAAKAAEIAGEVISQVTAGSGWVYYGWECSAALLPDVYEIGRWISFDGKELAVLNASYQFTAAGIIARLGAPAADGSFSDYSDLYARQLEGKVTFNSLFGCGIITPDGFGYSLKM